MKKGWSQSPDGHCRAFDAKAKGTVGGEGAGIIVLKPLKQALADGDCIYAVIKGSASNNVGTRKVGFSAPSIEGRRRSFGRRSAWAGLRRRASAMSKLTALAPRSAIGRDRGVEAGFSDGENRVLPHWVRQDEHRPFE